MTVQPWPLWQKIVFRFISSFFLAYILLGAFLSSVFKIIVPWFARHILGLVQPITIFTNGSGDTTYDYVTVLVYLSMALLATVIWSLVDMKRAAYHQLFYWVSLLLRYYLAMNMFLYGFAKVFHMQMPGPSLVQLIQPFGEKSPMGLAWSYVGYSSAFSAFTGYAEVIGGLLLLFGKTKVLGAILVAAIMLNVFVMNLFFDIPVKIFSFVLFAMALFIVVPNLKRLFWFFQDRAVAPSTEWYWKPNKKGLRYTSLVIKILAIIGVFLGPLYSVYSYAANRREKSPLYGIYNIKQIHWEYQEVPLLLTDSVHWKKLVLDGKERAQIQKLNDSIQYVGVQVDTANQSLRIVLQEKDTLSFAYQRHGNNLILEGNDEDYPIKMLFEKDNLKKYRLINTKFRWVNEYPYNR